MSDGIQLKPKERPSKRQRTVSPDPEVGGGHEAAGAGEGSDHDGSQDGSDDEDLVWETEFEMAKRSTIKDSCAPESDTYGLDCPRQVPKRHLCPHDAAASTNFAQKEHSKSKEMRKISHILENSL